MRPALFFEPWVCVAVDSVCCFACALNANEATNAIAVNVTFCRVGCFIDGQLIRNSGFLSRLFFGICESEKNGHSHRRVDVCATAWLKRRLPTGRDGLQGGPGRSRPAFSSFLQWPVFQPTQPVLDEKAKEHDARRHDVTIERDRKLDRRGGE